MTATCRDLFEEANSDLHSSGSRKYRSVNDVIRLVMDRLRGAAEKSWQIKRSANLVALTDLTPTQANRILGGKQNFSGPVLIHLLRSDHGERFLEAVMEGSTAAWWIDYALGKKLSSIQKRKAALKREEKSLEGAL